MSALFIVITVGNGGQFLPITEEESIESYVLSTKGFTIGRADMQRPIAF